MSRTQPANTESAYRKALDAGEIVADAAQGQALEALARLERELTSKQPFWRKRKMRGVYLHGPVGRGKTWLMDLFFHALPIEGKLRRHFHLFMREEVHAPLKKLAGERDPLMKIARELARRVRVICFDEFLVEDITDAMLLGTLFEALFAEGVALVATSNVAPDDLYRDGLQRERFLPAIAAIKAHCEVVHIAGGIDHRAAHIGAQGVWRTSSEADLAGLFRRLTHRGPNGGELRVNHRPIRVLGAGEDTLLLHFADLCDGPRSAGDYLELARRYHVIMLEGVPVLDDERLGAVRRFITLVDILYESHALLIAAAAAPPDSLYTGKRLRFEFKRTASRLEEMRSADWLAAHHLSHARALTPL